MQSVVLGRRRPSILSPGIYGDDDIEPGCAGGSHGLRHILRRLLGSIIPFPYTKDDDHPKEETDAESLDPETLERMVKTVKKMKLKKPEGEEDDIGAEIERLVELVERPRKLMRVRDGQKRRAEFWRRVRHQEDEDEGYSRRKRPSGDEESVSRRWRRKKIPRRRDREWEDGEEDRSRKAEEERQKKAFEEEWESGQKEGWHRRNREPREILYLPPQYPQDRHLMRARPADEYLK